MTIVSSIKEKEYYNAINVALNGDYRKIKNLDSPTWKKGWLKIQKDFPEIDPKKEYEKLKPLDIKLILKEDAEFPEMLKNIPWPPFAIYIKGNLHSLKSVSIVGTRKVSVQGKTIAKQIAKELAENNLQIISGLALGVDEASHQGALDGNGYTVAILPIGLGDIYPRQNSNLAKEILKTGGGLISEFPINYRPFTCSFIQRNRIISALSSTTIIIEAPKKSGALATARFALEQDREILVVPGPAINPNYYGSHKLIRDGARLITCAEDVLEDMGIEVEAKNQKNLEKMTEDEKKILEIINQLGWPASIDKISEISKIQIEKVNQIITFLTIKGILK
ncbi:DNA-processing protein DprA [Patescibacteria group bacterium]|nr:DNA-processing protein DprA [Patescibacteria group bacterium]